MRQQTMHLTKLNFLLTVGVSAAFLTETSKKCFITQNGFFYGQNPHTIISVGDGDQMSKDKTKLFSTRKEEMRGTSWMDKNKKFMNQDAESDGGNQKESRPRDNNFREDFRGTRVFVKNIPKHVSWQDLKDHFRIAGDVVFASISQDNYGESKGHGIVQFETTDGAKKAIRIMRDYPIDGSQLYVREDAQQGDGQVLRNVSPGGKRGFPTPPSKWKCADEEVLENMSQKEYKNIRLLIKERDKARFRRDYSVSDEMRDELKQNHNVHIDDRLKLWWVSYDGKSVPQAILEEKGDGRWGGPKPWRQIPTTPESDACVDPDLVEGLLRKRDVARRQKDFATADALLEEARTCPDDDLCLLIHDDSRTWRIWTETPPPRPIDYENEEKVNEKEVGNSIAEKCISLVQSHAPGKVEEIRRMLKEFPGREQQIFQKLQQKYK